MKPFNLTKPKPRKIQEPIVIDNRVKVKEIPKEEYNKVTLKKLEEDAKKRKEELAMVI